MEKRKDVLENEFHIPMTKEMEGDMQAMCNFSDAVEYYGEQKGFQRGVDQATLSNLRNLNESLGIPIQRIMDGMKLSPEDQEKYRKLLS